MTVRYTLHSTAVQLYEDDDERHGMPMMFTCGGPQLTRFSNPVPLTQYASALVLFEKISRE